MTSNKEALRTVAKCPLCHGWEYNPTEHGYGWCADKIEQTTQRPATGDGELDWLITNFGEHVTTAPNAWRLKSDAANVARAQIHSYISSAVLEAVEKERHPPIRWVRGIMSWGDSGRVPCVYAYAGRHQLGYYTTLEDQIKHRVLWTHNPERCQGLAAWKETYGIHFGYDIERPVGEIEAVVTKNFYDFLDSLFPSLSPTAAHEPQPVPTPDVGTPE